MKFAEPSAKKKVFIYRITNSGPFKRLTDNFVNSLSCSVLDSLLISLLLMSPEIFHAFMINREKIAQRSFPDSEFFLCKVI